jgi:hypothetical protein
MAGGDHQTVCARALRPCVVTLTPNSASALQLKTGLLRLPPLGQYNLPPRSRHSLPTPTVRHSVVNLLPIRCGHPAPLQLRP